jgi:hypothetical protein
MIEARILVGQFIILFCVARYTHQTVSIAPTLSGIHSEIAIIILFEIGVCGFKVTSCR